MNGHPPNTPGEAGLRVLVAWFLVSLSHMTLLEVVQLVAAIAATVYTVLQTFLLLRDRIFRKDRP